MNKKDERIRKLYERGITDPRVIAQKLGYRGNSRVAGVERVYEAFKRLGITIL